jgi:aspartyl-tRNA synthetase
MNQKAEDLMMNAPSEVMPKQLKELHIRIVGDAAPAGAKVDPAKAVAPE